MATTKKLAPQPDTQTGSDKEKHALTLRLSKDSYRRLRNYVWSVEQKTGVRHSHQEVIERGLIELMTKEGA